MCLSYPSPAPRTRPTRLLRFTLSRQTGSSERVCLLTKVTCSTRDPSLRLTVSRQFTRSFLAIIIEETRRWIAQRIGNRAEKRTSKGEIFYRRDEAEDELPSGIRHVRAQRNRLLQELADSLHLQSTHRAKAFASTFGAASSGAHWA